MVTDSPNLPAALEAQALTLGGPALVDLLHEVAAGYIDTHHPLGGGDDQLQEVRDAAYNAFHAGALVVHTVFSTVLTAGGQP